MAKNFERVALVAPTEAVANESTLALYAFIFTNSALKGLARNSKEAFAERVDNIRREIARAYFTTYAIREDNGAIISEIVRIGSESESDEDFTVAFTETLADFGIEPSNKLRVANKKYNKKTGEVVCTFHDYRTSNIMRAIEFLKAEPSKKSERATEGLDYLHESMKYLLSAVAECESEPSEDERVKFFATACNRAVNEYILKDWRNKPDAIEYYMAYEDGTDEVQSTAGALIACINGKQSVLDRAEGVNTEALNKLKKLERYLRIDCVFNQPESDRKLKKEPREVAILRLLARGYSYKRVARELTALGYPTVSNSTVQRTIYKFRDIIGA